ncbi:MAG: MFS transporter, partial [archaeon]
MNGNDRAIVGLVTLAHAMVHTFELSIPILMTEWLDAFPVTKATLGIVVGAGYALFGIGALPGGVLTDVVGSRRLIAGCLAGMAGSFLLLSLAPSVLFIAIALMLWGIAASVYHPSGLTLISKGVTARGEGLAYHGIAGNLGIAFGPLATTLLLLAFDWQTATALLVVPALLGAVVALRIDVDETAAVDVTDDGKTRGKAVTSVPEFFEGARALFVGWFVFVFGVVIMSGLYYRGVLT